MDKKSILAIVFITIIILLLPSYYKLINNEPVEDPPYLSETERDPVNQEKSQQLQSTKIAESEKPEVIAEKEETLVNDQIDHKVDSINQAQDEYFVQIETPLISTKISNKGGGNISEQVWNEGLLAGFK